MSEGPHVAAWREKQEAQHALDWRELLRQPWGRRWLQNVIESNRYCGAYASTFGPDGGPHDITTQSYLNGKRDVGLRLLTEAQGADFELYDRMIGEATNERRGFLIAQRSDSEPKKDS